MLLYQFADMGHTYFGFTISQSMPDTRADSWRYSSLSWHLDSWLQCRLGFLEAISTTGKGKSLSSLRWSGSAFHRHNGFVARLMKLEGWRMKETAKWRPGDRWLARLIESKKTCASRSLYVRRRRPPSHSPLYLFIARVFILCATYMKADKW